MLLFFGLEKFRCPVLFSLPGYVSASVCVFVCMQIMEFIRPHYVDEITKTKSGWFILSFFHSSFISSILCALLTVHSISGFNFEPIQHSISLKS